MTRLYRERDERILALRLTGLTMERIARQVSVEFGTPVTKNMVIGVCRRHGDAAIEAVTLGSNYRGALDHFSHNPPRTMEGRLRALHDRLDRVLALHAPRPEHFVPAPKLQLPRGAR